MITEFKIEGMSCDNCVAHVTNAVAALAGVRSVNVSLEHGRAVVDYDEAAVSDKSIAEAIDEEGYEAQPVA